jgi:hypothetical protein
MAVGVAPLAGVSHCGAVAGAGRPEAACGEPYDIGVDRDLDDGMAGAVVLPAGAAAEHAGQGLLPVAGGELAHPPLLARDPNAAAQGVVDGAGGVADRVPQLPRAVQPGEVAVAALGAENLWEGADVELPGVAAGGGAGPEPVAAADSLVRRQVAGDGPVMPWRAVQRRQAGRSVCRNPSGSRRQCRGSGQYSRAIRASGWPAAAPRRSCSCCVQPRGVWRVIAAVSSKASASSRNSRWFASASRAM